MAEIIPPHGGYRQLKSFQATEIVYDFTVAFCDLYRRSAQSHPRPDGSGGEEWPSEYR